MTTLTKLSESGTARLKCCTATAYPGSRRAPAVRDETKTKNTAFLYPWETMLVHQLVFIPRSSTPAGPATAGATKFPHSTLVHRFCVCPSRFLLEPFHAPLRLILCQMPGDNSADLSCSTGRYEFAP